MMDSVANIVNMCLKITLILSCLFGAATASSGERMVLCEEFTNRY